MNGQHSENFKMVCYDLLARLVPPHSRRKVLKNLLFTAKMACFRLFLLKTANSSEQLCGGTRRTKRALKTILKTSEFWKFT